MSREHVILDDPMIIALVQTALRIMPASGRFFVEGQNAFKKYFQALLAHFNLTFGWPDGLTLASLRGGGAIDLLYATQSPAFCQWRARWRNTRSMECYIQEVSALSIVPRLAADDRRNVILCAESISSVVAQTIMHFNAKP